jgi:predicted negative regulator of RcsB-dependent stress response
VDTQTRHALKTDSLAHATASSVDWLSEHRSSAIRWIVIAVVVIILGGGALVYWNVRSSAAEAALGAAMDTYTSPLSEPGAPAMKGFYSSASERSKAANKQFLAVTDQYGLLPESSKAHYFAGVTYAELGQTASAETELKKASGAWDRNLGNLAKLALAGVYHQTARDSQAIELYNELAAKPSETVSAGMAKLNLADLYVASGKQDEARKIWAAVKDADKEGYAGSIAAQKLAAKQ